MDSKDFKKSFNYFAVYNGFAMEFGAWFKESEECVMALILRKSNYSRFYYLRIKVNLKQANGRTFKKEKDWIKHDVADILHGPSNDFQDLFDLENNLKDTLRLEKMEKLFLDQINPLTNKILTREGIIELHKTENLFLLPAVKEELGL